jgi:hypothetical protein
MLIKVRAKVVSHGSNVVFQMAEVTIARQMFQEILRLIHPQKTGVSNASENRHQPLGRGSGRRLL